MRLRLMCVVCCLCVAWALCPLLFVKCVRVAGWVLGVEGAEERRHRETERPREREREHSPSPRHGRPTKRRKFEKILLLGYLNLLVHFSAFVLKYKYSSVTVKKTLQVSGQLNG